MILEQSSALHKIKELMAERASLRTKLKFFDRGEFLLAVHDEVVAKTKDFSSPEVDQRLAYLREVAQTEYSIDKRVFERLIIMELRSHSIEKIPEYLADLKTKKIFSEEEIDGLIHELRLPSAAQIATWQRSHSE